MKRLMRALGLVAMFGLLAGCPKKDAAVEDTSEEDGHKKKKKKVLLIGLDPRFVDLSPFPGLTEERFAASLAAQEQGLRDLGLDARWCLVDRGETAEAVVRAALDAKPYDVVLVGAGVRTLPEHFALFERLVNVIHRHAPQAHLCFNTRPDDTQEAVLRWLPGRTAP
jgi:hypothetical protein